MLVRVVYVSEIVEPLSDVDVQVLLGAAQVNNRRLDVTGMLAQGDGHFVQVLEGRRDAVDRIMARVRHDRRHRDVRCLLDEEIRLRRFAHWAMHLVRRDDMSDAMARVHREGTAAPGDVRDLVDRLAPRLD